MSASQRPRWFQPVSRLLIVCGMLCLIGGVILYGRHALSGNGSMLPIFFLLMSSLGFFNATTVIAKRLDRRAARRQSDDSV